MSIHFKLRGNAQNKISQAFYAACQFVKIFFAHRFLPSVISREYFCTLKQFFTRCKAGFCLEALILWGSNG